MFDTPDLNCFCIIPILGIIGIIIFALFDSSRLHTRLLVQRFGRSDPAPTFKPSEDSVVGSWQLNPAGTSTISIPSHTLVFKDDGTFHLNNVPAFWRVEGDLKLNQIEYINGSGVWHIDLDSSLKQKEWAVIAQLNQASDKVDTRVINFYFIGQLPPYNLVYINNEFYEFVKK